MQRAGHSSSGETLCGRVITVLKSQALLNESVGAGYIERNWPPALRDSGAWPLTSLKQSFLNGALTRLLDPDSVLRHKIVEFVDKGDFGLASGQKHDGTYERVWFEELIFPEEVAFETGVFLLTKAKTQTLKEGQKPETKAQPVSELVVEPGSEPEPTTGTQVTPTEETKVITLRLTGTIPPEIWNRLGTKILPKLRSGNNLQVGIEFSTEFSTEIAKTIETDLRQILQDLGIADKIRIVEVKHTES